MSPTPVIIAFLARAGSGKTTCAKYLAKKYGVHRVSFAGPVKELTGRVVGLDDAQLYGGLKEQAIPGHEATPREYMQRMGNEARDIIGSNVWIQAAQRKIDRLCTPLQNTFVIDDCRYLNEAAYISKQPLGFVVKLVAPDRVSAADPDHPSEREVDEVPPHHIDYAVYNTISAPDSLPTLFARVEEIYVDIRRRVREYECSNT